VIRGGTATNTFSLNSFSWPLPDPAMTAALNPDTTYTASKIVSYVRGECMETDMSGDTPCGSTVDPNFRDRRVMLNNGDTNGNVWKLGDIISSTPKVLGNTPLNTYHSRYSDGTYLSFISSPTYQQRPSVAFVGANDGMVHAFLVGFLEDTGLTGIKALFQNSSTDTGTNKLGDEEWAYIPFNAFPYLKYLADPGYCHIYFNDLSVRLVDVSTGGSPGAAKPADGSTWRTILIGGMRFGESCPGGTPNGPPNGTPANVGFSAYFAMDVTNPTSPVPLWEFSDPDLGYTTSLPTVLRTGDPGNNGNWYVAFGSGSTTLPMSGTDIERSTTGYVYILDLMKGTMLQKISLGSNAIVGDVLAVDAANDYNSEKMYFGTAVWNGSASAWNGSLMGISIPTNQDLSSWTPPAPTVLFSGAYPFTASPDATKDAVGHVWVYAGSGKYYSDVDESDTSKQIFLGLIDDPVNLTYPVNEGSTNVAACPSMCPTGSLCDVTNCTTSGTAGATVQMCEYNPATNTFGFQTVVTTVASSGNQPQSTIGWKIYFTDAERIISRPLAIGGLVDFLTYLPSGDPCKYGGNSYLYSVNYTTGLAPSSIAIRSPYATSGTSGTVTVNRGVLLGPGAPPTGEAIILAPQKDTAGN
jgi:type IV pilus assembly protein PilY1